MYLENLVLRNVANFEDISVDFPSNKCTVITGDPGVGKTVFLKAIASTILGRDHSNINTMWNYRKKNVTNDWLRVGATFCVPHTKEDLKLRAIFCQDLKSQLFRSDVLYCDAKIQGIPSEFTTTSTTLDQMFESPWVKEPDVGRRNALNLLELENDNPPSSFFIAAYGATCTGSKGTYAYSPGTPTLFERLYPLQRDIYPQGLGFRHKYQEDSTYNREVVSTWTTFSRILRKYDTECPEDPFDPMICKGAKYLLAMMGDLVGQNMQYKQPLSKLEGVVLIDDLGLPVHTFWQPFIMPWLHACLPKVQFIVTTDVPLVSVLSQDLHHLLIEKRGSTVRVVPV